LLEQVLFAGDVERGRGGIDIRPAAPPGGSAQNRERAVVAQQAGGTGGEGVLRAGNYDPVAHLEALALGDDHLGFVDVAAGERIADARDQHADEAAVGRRRRGRRELEGRLAEAGDRVVVAVVAGDRRIPDAHRGPNRCGWLVADPAGSTMVPCASVGCQPCAVLMKDTVGKSKVSRLVTVMDAGVMLNVVLPEPVMVIAGAGNRRRADRPVTMVRHPGGGGEVHAGERGHLLAAFCVTIGPEWELPGEFTV
jgi:hypothetical protein